MNGFDWPMTCISRPRIRVRSRAFADAPERCNIASLVDCLLWQIRLWFGEEGRRGARARVGYGSGGQASLVLTLQGSRFGVFTFQSPHRLVLNGKLGHEVCTSGSQSP